ncbi:MAG: DUF1080 domain-containing protein [Lentisphaeraceae bacterium]|nr:DUF1080 domain-containing protein [Lentisphaeraceae bacterium]
MPKFLFLASLFVFFSVSAEEGFVNMFNGKDLTGWENPYEWGEITVAGDEIHMNTKKKKFFLCTEKKYKDFIFEVEIKMPEGKSNSGVLFRCMKKKNKAWGYQAECDPSDRKWSGGLYDEGRRKWMHPDRDFKVGKDEFFTKNLSPEWSEEKKNAFKRHDWNKYRIECKGSEIKISINGVLTTHIIDSKDSEGYIGLQHHGEKGKLYKFRNAKIKELK